MFDKAEKQFVRDGAEKVTDEDFDKVVDRSDAIANKFETKGALSRFVEDAKLMVSIVKDFRAGLYKKIPYGVIAAIVFSLLYVFNPFDLLPDALPFIGVIDDATVVGVCLMAVERDLHQYRAWKQSQGHDITTS